MQSQQEEERLRLEEEWNAVSGGDTATNTTTKRSAATTTATAKGITSTTTGTRSNANIPASDSSGVSGGGGTVDPMESFGEVHAAVNNNNNNNSSHNNNNNNNNNNITASSNIFTKISYPHALAHVQGLDLSVHNDIIAVRDTDRSTNSFVAMLSRPCELKFENCETQLAFPFLLAQVDYEPGYPDLFAIMRSIFQGLTDMTESVVETRECPRTGPHWEQIGTNVA